MATLKGQNFRVLTYDKTASKFKCVAMATSCTINLTADTEEAATKDILGGAKMPEVNAHSWQVSVETLDVTDIQAIIAAVKGYEKFTLLWDEVSITDNQTPLMSGFARTGSAYLNSASFKFDNRTNSTKSLQFTGVGQLAKVTTTPAFEPIAVSTAFTKGQFVRLFIGSDATTTPASVVAYATSLGLDLSMELEESTTKDTTGDWKEQEPTGYSFSITSNSLVRSGDTITSQVAGKTYADLMDIFEAGNPVRFEIANVGGDNNRTKLGVLASGLVVVTALNSSHQNRQNSTYDVTLSGYGELESGSES